MRPPRLRARLRGLRHAAVVSVVCVLAVACGGGVPLGSDGGEPRDAGADSEDAALTTDAASREGRRHVPDVPDGLVDVFEACDETRCEGVNLTAAGGGVGWDCVPGAPLGAAYRVANCGTASTTTDVVVSFRLGDEAIATAVAPAGIPPGKGIWLTFAVPWDTWSESFGVPMTVDVDLGGAVAECREDDNQDLAGPVPGCP